MANFESTDNLYREIVMDHYKNPRNSMVLQNADVVQNEINPSCGDTTSLYLRFAVAGGKKTVIEAAHTTGGCALSIAAMSLLTEHIKGKRVEELENMGAQDMFSLLGIKTGPSRINCVLLPLATLKRALKQDEISAHTGLKNKKMK